jgi:uncharacterized protein (TIGR00290 family)
MQKKKKHALLAWSGGKDAALALYFARLSGEFNIVTLVTTVELPSSKTTMHRNHTSLVELQAMRMRLPLKQIFMSDGADADEYNFQMEETIRPFRDIGIDHIIFGDIFLDEIRKYREDFFRDMGMQTAFPLWGKDTSTLADEFFKAGFKAKVICVNANVLEGDFAGREYDETFLAQLPAGIDPCGENGEFHTYVYDSPMFRRPIELRDDGRDFVVVGEEGKGYDTGFWYNSYALADII